MISLVGDGQNMINDIGLMRKRHIKPACDTDAAAKKPTERI